MAKYNGLNATLVHNLKKKIEELRASEEKFRIIFEGANDGILVADAKTKKFVFANPKICKLTGYSEKELLELGIEDIHPKKDLPYVLDQFKEQMQGSITLAKDLPVLRKDKKVVYCDINAAPLKIKDQEVVVGFFRDTTERREAEEKLKESEKKFRIIFESGKVGMAVSNLKGMLIDANKTFCDMHGYTREDLVNKKTFMGLTPKKWVKYELDIIKNQVMKRGYSDSFEKEQIKKNGEVFPVDVTIHLIKDEQGKPSSLWAIVRDITERKKAEEKFKTFFEHMPDIVQSVGPDAKFKYVNKEWRKILGYGDRDIKKMKIWAIIKKSELKHCEQIFKQIMFGKSFRNVKTVFVSKKGREILVNGSINPVIENKKMTETIGIFRKI